jgi:hypothetical protein
MTWNHRVVSHSQAKYNLPDWLEICEVYYKGDKVIGHTKGVAVGGETIQELRTTLERMLACLDKEIIKEVK